MDELVEAFAGAQVTEQPNSTFAEHPFFSLYKAKKRTTPQEERRRWFLENQKLKRYDYVSHARNLAENKWEKDDDDEEEEEEMDYKSQPRRPSRSYRNQLMLSEWLVEVPTDLMTEWFLVLCPVGKRNLVVASRGSTKSYSKGGYLISNFPSYLPGGSRTDKYGNRGGTYSLLDCIYNEVDKTFYILDVMCWNSHPCFESETEFRFYWVQSKLKEYPNIQLSSDENHYKFVPLPYFDCDKASIKSAISSPMPFPCKLDGLLFYHKKTHYTCGVTPLVGWLKAYMLPEILNIDVPSDLMAEKPASYTCMKEHVPEAFALNEQRKKEAQSQMQCDET